MTELGWIAAALGWGLMFAWQWVARRQRKLLGECKVAINALAATITNLRNNCFIPNEKGHKKRYWEVSAERRAKAEGDA